MNHFEELGLPRSAGTRDIREAYKVLAGVLHPDRHRGEAQRRLAEIQMKRLNACVDTLLDANRRRDYEAELDTQNRRPCAPQVIVIAPAAPPDRWWRAIDARSGLLFAAGAAFASLVWWAADTGRAADAVPLPSTPAAAVTANADLRSRVSELEARLQELQLGPGKLAHASALSVEDLDGFWYYDASPSRERIQSAFARIELTITADEGGVLQGRYRADTKPIAEQPGSRVLFEFSGLVHAPRARLPWSDSGGGAGEIELRLLSKDTLETRWWAYSAEGSTQENYGTAVLRRYPGPPVLRRKQQ